MLYTITSDATLRIFLPVLDSPQHVQLHASLDVFSALPFSIASQVTESHIFSLSREVMSNALKAALETMGGDDEDARSIRVRDIRAESWDLFLRVLGDGALVVQAVAVSVNAFCLLRIVNNVDRFTEYRPPASNPAEAIYAPPVSAFRNLQPATTPIHPTQSPRPSEGHACDLFTVEVIRSRAAAILRCPRRWSQAPR